MSQMRCLIVDDNKLARTALAKLVEKAGFLSLVDQCESPEAAFHKLQQENIDLVFLDIEMPGMSGLDLIRALPVRPLIILITAKRDYAVEAYELNVVDYLVKPVALPRFFTAVNRAREIWQTKEQEVELSDKTYIFVRSNGLLTKIRHDDILYAQALGDYVTIYTTDKKHTVHLTLRTLEEKLPADKFFRLHRSYLAGIDHIDTIEENTAYIHGHPLPVGEQQKATLLKLLNLI